MFVYGDKDQNVLKVSKKSIFDQKMKAEFITEIEIMKAIKGFKHIVAFKGAYVDSKNQLCIEMERLDMTL